jgi:hypothetical protein
MNADPTRIVCWFSCGAASAVAAKLAIQDNAGRLPLVVAYTEVMQEHPDNRRFLAECEKWFGVPITVLRNERYGGDIYEVFLRTRYLVGPSGAACTRLLKKGVRNKFERPGDRQVFGFTAEEQQRYEDFQDDNAAVDVAVPLIEHKLSKQDCLGVLARGGIEIPAMYKLGYKNNNCIGCVKGGAGYWNKIRVDFPEVFEKMAQVEEELGRTINVTRVGGERKRITLRQLDPAAGRYEDEADISCGVVCNGIADRIFISDLC